MLSAQVTYMHSVSVVELCTHLLALSYSHTRMKRHTHTHTYRCTKAALVYKRRVIAI